MLGQRLFLLVLLTDSATQAADVCNPADLLGPYAFQLTGSTDISGTPKPTVSLGRITFDGRGSLSGTASATFQRTAFGKPGDGELRGEIGLFGDLEDAGRFRRLPEFQRNTFRRWNAACNSDRPTQAALSAASCRKHPIRARRRISGRNTTYTVSGSTTPMQPGEVPHIVSAKGTLDIAENGSFQVESDCSVRFVLTLPAQEGRSPNFADDHARISGRRQGNPGLPDRPGRNGVRALHFRYEVNGLDPRYGHYARGHIAIETASKSSMAGPLITLPQASNLDPWQGQSHVRSVEFQSTRHPRWGHMAES